MQFKLENLQVSANVDFVDVVSEMDNDELIKAAMIIDEVACCSDFSKELITKLVKELRECYDDSSEELKEFKQFIKSLKKVK